MRKSCFAALGLVAVLGGASTKALADLPLTVEDLITDRGRLKIDLSFAYANQDRRGISALDPIIVQTGPTSFVTVPTTIGERFGNTDTLVGTLGVRYGLTTRAEFYSRATGLISFQRTNDVTGISSSRESQFADAWAGVNVQFKEDDETPALLGFVEVALLEKHSEDTASLKSAMLGITTYRAIDPVVFSLTAAYRFNSSRQNGGQVYRPGNLVLLNPSVSFAVNDRVTLTTGLQWTRRAADQLNGRTAGIDRTATDLILGVGYGITRGNTLFANFKTNASGSDGAEFRVDWIYLF
jgi:hypothetical protein